MLTRRDLVVAALAVGTTCAVLAAVNPSPVLIRSSTYDWKSFTAKPNPVGETRFVANGPTATLQNLEMHITTLNPGTTSHPPHRHPNEEIIILRQGTVETLSNGTWVKLGPGSVIFNGSNELHGLRNVGPDQAIYHVINVQTAATPPVKP
jgi:quercetin dioxygenase-like cupin family protein